MLTSAEVYKPRYFHIWRRNYATLVDELLATPPKDRNAQHAPLKKVQDSLEIACIVFFHPNSPLELNVPGDLRRELERQLKSDSAKPEAHYVAPACFDRVGAACELLLQQSFRQFLAWVKLEGNVGCARAVAGKLGGVALFTLGLVPTIVATLLDQSRAWRALGFPLWFLGMTLFIGAMRRVSPFLGQGNPFFLRRGFRARRAADNLRLQTCLLVYLFGDNRQLYPWELVQVPLSSATCGSPPGNVAMGESDADVSSSKLEPASRPRAALDMEKPIELSGAEQRKSWEGPRAESYAIVLPSSRDAEISVICPWAFDLEETHYFPRVDQPRKASVSSQPGGLYFAPGTTALPAVRAWAPITRVASPLMSNHYRGTVLVACAYGLGSSLLALVICLSVPNLATSN